MKGAAADLNTQYLYQIGFKMSKFDNSMFILSECRGQLFIIIYVNDLVIEENT